MSESILLGLCICLTGLILLKEYYFAPASISLVGVNIAATVAFFGLGWLISETVTYRIFDTEVLPNRYIIFSSVLMYIISLKIGELICKLMVRAPSAIAFVHSYYVNPNGVLLIYTLTVVGRIYKATEYSILFSGRADIDKTLSIPYPVVATFEMLDFFSAGSLLWACFFLLSTPSPAARKLRIHYAAAIIVLVSEGFWSFLNGRTGLTVFMVIVGIAILTTQKRAPFRSLFGYASLAVPAIIILFPFFFAIRYYHEGVEGNVSAFSALMSSVDTVLTSDSFFGTTEGKKEYFENIRERTVSGHVFIDEVLQKQDRIPLPYGDLFVRNIVRAIPSAFGVDKTTLVSVEAEIQKHYRLYDEDANVTVLALAVADFGWMGAAVYGVWLGICIGIIPYIALRLYHFGAIYPYCLIGRTLIYVLRIEEDPAWIPLLFRDIFILFAIALIGWFLKSIFVRKAGIVGQEAPRIRF